MRGRARAHDRGQGARHLQHRHQPEVKTGKKGKMKKVTRWIHCDDWRGLAAAAMVRKGDRLRLTGHFRERTYTKDGATKTAKGFVVQHVSLRT